MVLLVIRHGEKMRGVGKRWAGEKVGRESEETLAEEAGKEEKV